MTALRHNYSVLAYNAECDSCGKERHTIYVVAVNPWDDVVEHAECYFCLLKSEKFAEEQEAKMMDEYYKENMESIIREEEDLVREDE